MQKFNRERRRSLVIAFFLVTSAFSFLPPTFSDCQSSAVGLGKEKGNPTKRPPLVIDINQASAQDFQRLQGIGPELARRIVTYRQKHGPFRRVEDLLAIRGIGPKKWRALRPNLRVGGSAGKGPR